MSLVPLSGILASGRSANHVVALRDGEPYDFGRFAADVNGVATAAARLRIRRAALVCRGSYAFIVGLFGLLRNGCEIVLPPNGQSGTLESLRDHFELLVDDAFVRKSEPVHAEPLGLNAERPSLLFFTSGSTGAPKQIVKTLAMLEREITALQALWDPGLGQGTVFATVSHQHIYGMTFKVLWPFAAGLPFADETDELWEGLLARISPAATLVSGPAHLSRVTGLAPLPQARFPRRIFSAGAPLGYEAAAEVARVFGRLPTEIFGSTETGAIATREQAQCDEAWRLLPGNAMRQSDEGCLQVLSPWVGDDWYETADVVEPAPDGFRFLGRADRIVKVEGKRISLPEIEQTLSRLPWITGAAATLLPGSPARLAAVVVLNDEGRARLAALGGFRFGRLLRTELAMTQEPAGMPRLWRFVDELPSQDGMGKRRDRDIRDLFGKQP